MKKNMIGNTYGLLKVLSLDEEKNKKLREERNNGLRSSAPLHYICQCECGNICSVNGQKLRNGHTKSCGCICKKYNFNDESYINKTYGNWKILKYAHYNKGKHYFLCECSCGEIKVVDAYNLIYGQTHDCGCGRNEKMRELNTKDIVGLKFGKITVEEYMYTDKNRCRVYKCKCDCGTETKTIGRNLLSGHVLSCGCLKSKNNIVISNILTEMGIHCDREYYFSVDDTYGRFDIYIPSLNTAIEYDGEQHYFPIDFAGKGEDWALEQFEKTKHRDKIKNEYCKNNNIKILRIPYWENKNIENIIKEFINKITLND